MWGYEPESEDYISIPHDAIETVAISPDVEGEALVGEIVFTVPTSQIRK